MATEKKEDDGWVHAVWAEDRVILPDGQADVLDVYENEDGLKLMDVTMVEGGKTIAGLPTTLVRSIIKFAGATESLYSKYDSISTGGIMTGKYKPVEPPCKHDRDKLAVAEFQVNLSGKIANPSPNKVQADVKFYLDQSRLPVDLYYTADAPENGWEDVLVYIPWPDWGVIPMDLLARTVTEIHQALQDKKTVEIGCVGGHGRTGTLTAALVIKLMDMDSEEAITYVRENYCKKAVESKGQKDLLKAFADTLQEEKEA